MSSVYVTYTTGSCWRRVLDAKCAKNYFLANGFSMTSDPKKADILFVITCAFIKKTEDIAICHINELKKLPGRLVISGCLPAMNPDRLKKTCQCETCGACDMAKLDELFPGSKIKFNEIDDSNELLTIKTKSRSFTAIKTILQYYFPNFFSLTFQKNFFRSSLKALKTYKLFSERLFFMRIAWGCGGFADQPACTYCSEWKAIGTFRSKQKDKCLREFEKGLSQGYKTFVLLADNIGAYGVDTGETFTGLVRELMEKSPKDVKFVIDSIHPIFLIKYLKQWIEIFKTKRIKWIMCAIQSGDNNVLKIMNRQHTAEDLHNAITQIFKVCPDLKMSTQVIIGFPGETEQAFQNSLDFLKNTGFFNAVLFPYCRIPNTIAGDLEGHISSEIINDRLKRAKKFLQKNGMFHFHLKLDI
ncbi:MAG: radical SAM protein [Candidatus Omnitrophica bacterium]|nr:radical SAM protein [Candidatus Omnitrophota bacterium]